MTDPFPYYSLCRFAAVIDAGSPESLVCTEANPLSDTLHYIAKPVGMHFNRSYDELKELPGEDSYQIYVELSSPLGVPPPRDCMFHELFKSKEMVLLMIWS